MLLPLKDICIPFKREKDSDWQKGMRNTYFNLAWKLTMSNNYRKGTIKLGK